MVNNVFLLGRPGCGKSSVAQLIEMIASDRGCFTHHIYDYKLLQEMFLREEIEDVALEKKKFSRKGPKQCQGFDVVKFSVLDTVLELMADEVRKEQQAFSKMKKLNLIEFARDDYIHALQTFGLDLLQNAYLLYLKAGVETCIERVRRRVDFQQEPYNHFVSENIMRDYYREDDWSNGRLHEYLDLLQSKGIHVNAKEIDNIGSTKLLQEKVEQWVDIQLIPEPTPV